jgi:amino acid permease
MEFIQIADELENHTTKRVRKVVAGSILINFTLYTTIAMAGYFSTFDQTKHIVLERELPKGWTSDIPIIVARVVVIFVVCIAFAVNLVALKKVIFHYLFKGGRTATMG